VSKRGRPPLDPAGKSSQSVHVKLPPMLMQRMRVVAAYHGTTVSCLTRRWYVRVIEKNTDLFRSPDKSMS